MAGERQRAQQVMASRSIKVWHLDREAVCKEQLGVPLGAVVVDEGVADRDALAAADGIAVGLSSITSKNGY